MSVTFQLTGDKQLDRAFQQLPLVTEKKVLRQALRESAKLIQKQAQINAPVRQLTGLQKRRRKIKAWKPQPPPGRLKRSLTVRAGKKRQRGVVRMIVQTKAGFFKGDTFYGAFVEYGTKHIRPRGFIKRAYDTQKERAKQVAIEHIKAGIEREAKALGNRALA